MTVGDDTQAGAVAPPLAPAPPSQGELQDIQRARVLSAMIEVVAEHGYIGAAVAPVVARAGVSRRTFYELFDGREDCFLAAFDWGVEQLRACAVDAYGSRHSWRDRVRHGLAALLALLDAEPELTRVCVIEALGAGKLVLDRRAQVLDQLTSALDAEAHETRTAGETSLLTAAGVVGGALSMLHARVLENRGLADAEGSSRPLLQMHGQLMAVIMLPYRGSRIAAAEFTRPAPDIPRLPRPHVAREPGRLLERLDMRLTYRTVRCLMFIGEHPGCSNREIAKGAEVPDEGQASKLLARLAKLGLATNTRTHGPGYPNYWTLTPQGNRVLSTVQKH